jgi:hypothetical protein
MESGRRKTARATSAAAASLLATLAVSACGNSNDATSSRSETTASAETIREDWVARIDYACREPTGQIAVAAASQPTTLKQKIELTTRLLPLERQWVGAVTHVEGPKPPGADRAISLMRESVAELAHAHAARRSPSKFRAMFALWQRDVRATYALDALGSHTCAL